MTTKVFQKYSVSSFFLNAPLVINAIITLAALPTVLANLPICNYGKWQFVLALQVWLTAFSAGNITTASKRGIARGLNGTFLYGFLARLKLLVPTGIVVLGIAFYFRVLERSIFSTLLTIMGLHLIFGYLFHISFYEYLIAKKKFRQWCYWQILISSTSVFGSATTAYFTKSVVYFALFQLGSVSALGLIAFLWIVKEETLIDSYRNKEIDKECVRYGLRLIPFDLFSVTAGKSAQFIIGSFLGFVNLSIFSVANKLRDKCAGIIKSVRPLFYADFAKMQKKELLKIVNRHLIKIGAFGVILTVGLIGAGWFYIKFFLPATFHQAIFYFTILALGFPAVILVIVLHTLLESHLRYKELTIVGIIPSALKIILILIFGYFSQIIGVCVALAISSWVTFGFYYLLTLKRETALELIHKYPWLEKLAKKY